MCGEFNLDQRPAVPTTLNRAKILHPLLIGTPIRLKMELTHSQQTRKHFLIGTIRPTLAPAPLSTPHSSLVTAPPHFYSLQMEHTKSSLR
jgi:hypothetical protein